MPRLIPSLILALLLAPGAASAQAVLIPSDRSPYRQKFDLQLLDAQYFFVPQGALPAVEGPLRFRFENPDLNAVLEHPSAVRYVSLRDGGILLQLYHLRVREVPEGAVGPQDFEVLDGAEQAIGRGTMLVLGRLPEPVELVGEEGRIFEVGRESEVELRIRPNANWWGDVRVVNLRDFDLVSLTVDEPAAPPGGWAAPADPASTWMPFVDGGEAWTDRTDPAAVAGTAESPRGPESPAATRVPGAPDSAAAPPIPGHPQTPTTPPAPETLVLRARVRPLRAEATELRLAAETRDGRTAELVFGGLVVRPSAPRRIRVGGGPIYLDGLGRGAASVVVSHFSVPPAGLPEIVPEGQGELVVTEQRYDAVRQEIHAQVELVSRGSRAPGLREVREIQVRSGLQVYRGLIEVVGAPTISGVRTEQHARPLLTVGGAPTLLRITGQNLDGLRLDCAPLGPGARCESLASSPTELVEAVTLDGDVRDGETVLPLIGTEARRLAEGPLYPGGGVRVEVQRPAVPLLLASRGLLSIDCGSECRHARGGESMVVRQRDALDIRLALDDAVIPPEHGWQRVVVTVTRVRGDQRQVVRSLGTPAVPRTYRHGQPAGSVPLLDAGADPRHGDLFIVRVEHAAEQYPPEYRNLVAAGEPWVRRVYVDGGAHRRLTGDIAVQPVLFSFSDAEEGKRFVPLYPNAGLGITWQFLNERMEPRPLSAKLQFLATDLLNARGGEGGAEPALLLSGNLRIPGTDPSKPLVITTGVARMLTGANRWRIMAGAGMDLGVAKMIFGP